MNKKAEGVSGFNHLIRTYKRSALERGLEWALTDRDAGNLFQSDCYYCGDPPNFVSNNHGSIYVYNGIDRVDSAAGVLCR